MLKRSALADARFDSGWNASPASLTSDSVSWNSRRLHDRTKRGRNRPATADIRSATWLRRANGSRPRPVRSRCGSADNVLAERASALGGDAAGLDYRFNVGTREIGQFLSDLLAALREVLAALTGVGEQRLERRERGNGVEAVEHGLGGHGLDPLLGRNGDLRRLRVVRVGGQRRLARDARVAVFGFLRHRSALGAASGGRAGTLGGLGAFVRTFSIVSATVSATLAGASAAALRFDFVFVSLVNSFNMLQCTIYIAPHHFKRFFVHATFRRLTATVHPKQERPWTSPTASAAAFSSCCHPPRRGKSTIARMLLDADPEVTMSISATTRAKRPGEANDVDYHFVDDARFEELVRAANLPNGPMSSTIATAARRSRSRKR